MEKKIMKTIKEYKLIAPKDTIVAAVSGGPDSMVMLDLVSRITAPWQVKIVCAHLNHMFRGAESDEEAEFVKMVAGKMGIPFLGQSFDVPDYIKKSGLSPEEAAREVRYKFLRLVAKEVGAVSVMTAHHANDQAETLLLHLIRGAGPEGMAGIAPKEGNLIRPLLHISKEEILNYCEEKNLPYRMDSSNLTTIYTRNKIRLDLIPRLEEYNPNIIKALDRTAKIFRGENEFLERLAQNAAKRLGIIYGKEEITLPYSGLMGLEPVLQSRIIRNLIDVLTGHQGVLGFFHTQEVLALAPGKEICLPGGLFARHESGQMIIGINKSDHEYFTNIGIQPVRVPGTTELPQLGICLETARINWPDPDFKPGEYQQVFSLKILEKPLGVRTRIRGDCFHPKGLKGSKKLKEYFIDQKIPRARRDSIPLLISGNQIIWVIGDRTSALGAPQEGDSKVLAVMMKKFYKA